MFNLVETFFVEVNLEVSNFYQFCHPPPGFYWLALTLAIRLFAYKLVAYKKEGYIQDIDLCFPC